MRPFKSFRFLAFTFIITASLLFYGCQNKYDSEAFQASKIAAIDSIINNSDNHVSFQIKDTSLQLLYNTAELKAKENIRDYGGKYKVLVEGGSYPFVWIETQPMGGTMYAKRDLRIAHDNVSIFMDFQHDNGRYPGMVMNMDNDIWKLKDLVKISDDGKFGALFGSLQGLCFPSPALELAYLLDKDVFFLEKLYQSLEAYDNYLWEHRDSDGDGCLEAWCMTDTGEDHLSRFDHAPWSWPFDYPPLKENIPVGDSTFLKAWWGGTKMVNRLDLDSLPVPMESIDIMGYSYTCRDVLSQVAGLLENGQQAYWKNKAESTLKVMKDYLWIPEKHAYFFRDTKNEFIPTLTHNNLRAMYFGAMTQEMADEFIRYHLLNPEEFFTYVPLPSVAANDLRFKNIANNNWSGQPQGLTFQRAIRALENYGHYAEIGLIGEKLLQVTAISRSFTQQFDPFTGAQNGLDGYAPTILSVLEYVSRMYGVHYAKDTLHFNGLPHEADYTYHQRLKGKEFTLSQSNAELIGKIDEEEIFRSSAGVKVKTTLDGDIIEIIGIDTKAIDFSLTTKGKSYKATISPNGIYEINGEEIRKKEQVAFDYPFVNENT